ncbi:hypothetical protein [Streptomyces sp. NPDC006879]
MTTIGGTPQGVFQLRELRGPARIASVGLLLLALLDAATVLDAGRAQAE